MAKYVKTEQGYQEIEATVAPMVGEKMNANNPVGTGSFSMGRKSGSVIGTNSHAEGFNTTASGERSHAEGASTTASSTSSHAEGMSTIASGEGSHAEGVSTRAESNSSHAEGNTTTASGNYSHAEGTNTHAEGNSSHAEGNKTNARGKNSHAEGDGTIASSTNQHAQGRFNVADSHNKYAHIVGNGTNLSIRSNAHTLDWNGVPWFKGRPQFGGTAQDQGSQTVMANGDKEIILASSTANSTKKFKITVDDSGAISATEVI